MSRQGSMCTLWQVWVVTSCWRGCRAPAGWLPRSAGRVVAGAGCAEEAGQRRDCLLQQGVETGLLVGGAAGAELGDGAAVLVLGGGGGGDEGGDSGVVEGAGQPGGDAVQPGGGVVCQQRLVAAGQGQVVFEVGGGFGEVHRLDREPGGDPLVEEIGRAHV